MDRLEIRTSELALLSFRLRVLSKADRWPQCMRRRMARAADAVRAVSVDLANHASTVIDTGRTSVAALDWDEAEDVICGSQ